MFGKMTTAQRIRMRLFMVLVFLFTCDVLAAGDATQNAQKIPGNQDYHKVDRALLPLVVEAKVDELWQNSDGIQSVRGTVRRLAVGDSLIELSSDQITQEGKDAFISTKRYGKFKLTFDNYPGYGISVWLKAPQLDQLKKSVKSEAKPVSAGESEPRKEGTYVKVDPGELALNFEAAMRELEVDSAGRTVSIRGTVKKLCVGNTQLQLASDAIAKLGDEVFIQTLEYGRFKLTFDSNGVATIWLTSEQKAQLKKLNSPGK